MSYIRSEGTYAYPDSDGNLIIHTDHCIDHMGSSNIGKLGKPYTKDTFGHRYMVTIPFDEFVQMVRRMVTDVMSEHIQGRTVRGWLHDWESRERAEIESDRRQLAAVKPPAKRYLTGR